jgi:hypothetical protein
MTDDNNDDRPFHVRLAERYREVFKPHENGPKLTHDGRCEVYALLYWGAPRKAVGRLFGLAHGTVSTIGGCRDDDRKPVTFEMTPGHNETVGGPKIRGRNMNRKPRYQDVAQEFESLGEDAFMRRYLTPGLNVRLQNTLREMREEYRQNRLDKGLSL